MYMKIKYDDDDDVEQKENVEEEQMNIQRRPKKTKKKKQINTKKKHLLKFIDIEADEEQTHERNSQVSVVQKSARCYLYDDV